MCGQNYTIQIHSCYGSHIIPLILVHHQTFDFVILPSIMEGCAACDLTLFCMKRGIIYFLAFVWVNWTWDFFRWCICGYWSCTCMGKYSHEMMTTHIRRIIINTLSYIMWLVCQNWTSDKGYTFHGMPLVRVGQRVFSLPYLSLYEPPLPGYRNEWMFLFRFFLDNGLPGFFPLMLLFWLILCVHAVWTLYAIYLILLQTVPNICII